MRGGLNPLKEWQKFRSMFINENITSILISINPLDLLLYLPDFSIDPLYFSGDLLTNSDLN